MFVNKMSFQEMLLNGLSNIQSEGDLFGVLQNAINTGSGPRTDGRWSPCIDIVDTTNNLYVYIDIPGVSENSISVDFFNNKLSVSGDKIKRYQSPSIKNEIIYGNFIRCITLPMSVTNQSNVNVTYTNGVLKLVIDKQKEEQNRFTIGVSNSSNECNSDTTKEDDISTSTSFQ